MVHKKTFTTYMKSVLKNSMLTGIPQIVGARSTGKKIIRGLVFFLCIGGFIFQAQEFMELYWQYKVLLDVKVDSPEQVTIPAFTICNVNGIKQSEYIKDHPNSVQKFPFVEAEQEICECTPRYCDNNKQQMKVKIMKGEALVRLQYMSHTDVQKYIQKPRDLIISCTEVGMSLQQYDSTECDFSKITSVQTTNMDSFVYPVCYTINSLSKQPNAAPKTVLSSGAILVEADPMPIEYPKNIRVPSLSIAFHSPYAISNPFVGNFVMNSGKHYNFRLKKVVREALKAPYETNCTDYIGLWKARDGYGPTNQEECIDECYVNVTLQLYGCKPEFVHWPINYRKCEEEISMTEVLYLGKQCADANCRVACWEESYVAEVAARDQDVSIEECLSGNATEDKANRITFRIYLNNMETTYYRNKPQFESIETFSYVGGYIGMWLGISLLALFDFLESLVTILNYPFCKKDNKPTVKSLQATNVRPQ